MVCQALSQPTKDSPPDPHLLHLLELVTLTPRGCKVLIPPGPRWTGHGAPPPPPDPAPDLAVGTLRIANFQIAPNSQKGSCENLPKLNVVHTDWYKCEWGVCTVHWPHSRFSAGVFKSWNHLWGHRRNIQPPYTLWEPGCHVKDSGQVSESASWGHKSLNDSAIKHTEGLASFSHCPGSRRADWGSFRAHCPVPHHPSNLVFPLQV